jgi:DNA-binding response OmpR family regulator
MNILIIDDEPEIGFVLSLELKFAGHESVSFDTTVEAQRYLLTKPKVDAIICDFQMPEMNGLELFQWARENSFIGPFYILTGEPTMDVKHLLDLGITEVLFKPQDLNKLPQLFK